MAVKGSGEMEKRNTGRERKYYILLHFSLHPLNPKPYTLHPSALQFCNKHKP